MGLRPLFLGCLCWLLESAGRRDLRVVESPILGCPDSRGSDLAKERSWAGTSEIAVVRGSPGVQFSMGVLHNLSDVRIICIM